jgi:hypothetical protein
MRILLSIALPSFLGCVTVSPAQAPLLLWSVQAPAATAEGSVAVIQVVNQRTPNRGGPDLNLIANWRNAFGGAQPIRVDDSSQTTQPINVQESLTQLVTQALRAAGIGTTAAGDVGPTAHVVVEVGDFFADGYMGTITAKVALTVIILDPRTRAERRRLNVSSEGNWESSGPDCAAWEHVNGITALYCKPYDHALSVAAQDLAQAFSKPEIRAALVGSSSPSVHGPAEVAPQSVPADGCKKDTDCKGNRICVRGECTNP